MTARLHLPGAPGPASLAAWLATLMLVSTAFSAPRAAPATPPARALTLGEALELALVHNHALQVSRLDVDEADSQISSAWGSVYPRVDLNGRYTRTLDTPDPFAGSSAGGVFGGLDAIGWLAFNESARTDANPNTAPISFLEFQERRAAGLASAGLTERAPSNLFLVPNRVDLSVGITQVLYNRAAFAAIEGARAYRQQREAALAEQARAVADQVVRAWYAAMLAQARVDVLARSVERSREALSEIERRVQQGVIPTFHQLSAEVEVANLQTEHISAENQARATLDALRLLCGLPASYPVGVRGALALSESERAQTPLSLEDARETAARDRPDLLGLRLLAEVQDVGRRIDASAFWPVLSAFANFGVVGTIPDDRTEVVNSGPDPFAFEERSRGIFDDAYWGNQFNLGLSLTWNLFDGFQTTERVAQADLAVRRTRLQHEQLREAVYAEVDQAFRELDASHRRLQAQARNTERAQLNYDHARARVSEGVSTQLELRDASGQLDLSRLHELQATHDYLVARVRLQIALGTPPTGLSLPAEVASGVEP